MVRNRYHKHLPQSTEPSMWCLGTMAMQAQFVLLSDSSVRTPTKSLAEAPYYGGLLASPKAAQIFRGELQTTKRGR